MIVNRHRQNDTPPKMTIYFRTDPSSETTATQQPASSDAGLSKAQPPGPGGPPPVQTGSPMT